MIPVVVGAKIPLTLQVFDGNQGLKVEAVLTDNHGKEFSRVGLSHISMGLYANFEIEMPDADVLIAQYTTDKPDDYELVQDVFKSVPKPIPAELVLVGEVVSKSQWDDEKIIIGEAYVEKEA